MLISIRRATTLSTEKPWLVFVFFSLLSIFLRWSSFYRSMIDWDESLYVLVARAWLDGNPPYTAVWDNKPPGIYFIFSLAISAFGDSILSIRILACLFVAVTCFFLYKTGELIEDHGRKIGLLAGSLYAIATLCNGGMASNTELFFVAFVVGGFYVFFADSYAGRNLSAKYPLKLFLIGLLLGIAFEIKYVVLFDFWALAAILIFTFFIRSQFRQKYLLILKALLFLGVGFALPFVLVSAGFWLIGHFDDYIYANFTANKLRTVSLGFSANTLISGFIHQIKSNSFFWLSLPSAIAYLFIAKSRPAGEKWLISCFVIWFFAILLGVCTVFRGPLYDHYFLQFAPIFCFISAYLLVRLLFSSAKRFEQLQLKRYAILAAILIGLILTTEAIDVLEANAKYVYFRHVKGIRNWEDTPALIADYLKPRITPNDYIYMVNDAPIVYFLADAKIPTRYAFPPFLLLRKDLPNITGVSPVKELDLILRKRPEYIIKRRNVNNPNYVSENRIFLDKLSQALSQNYENEASIKEFDLYRLNAKP
jgi:4-amino-4-deoxy-L-arabinose transferase-like glycosyltransferase